MVGKIAAVLFFVLCLPAAMAAGYDDFTTGMTAYLRGDTEAAIKAFTVALAAPDLPKVYVAAAHRGRAQAYLRLDKCAEAETDIEAYIAQKGLSTEIRILRFWSRLCAKDEAAVQSEFAGLVGEKIGASDYWQLAQLEVQYGLFDGAAKTNAKAFAAVDKSTDDAAYILLWRAMSEDRAGTLDKAVLAADLTPLKLDKWPRPVLDLYLGKQTPKGVMDEATSWRRTRETAQMCEANYYVGEWQLARGDKAAAAPLLAAAVEKCPGDFIEYPAAAAEIKRQGLPPPAE